MRTALAPEISTWPQYKGPTGKDFVPVAFAPVQEGR